MTLGLFVTSTLACTLLLVLLLTLVGQAPTSAQFNPDFFYVTKNCSGIPNCYLSVQAALNATLSGDLILVAVGTYDESIRVVRNVSLQGGWDAGFQTRDPAANVTTLDAGGGGPVVRVEGRASPIIDGFYITGGDASDWDGRGGGIRVEDAGQVTIRRNVITDNVACGLDTCIGQGGGIAVRNAVAIIKANTIISNAAHTEPAGEGHGGGIYVGATASATLEDNDIVSNTASLQGLGMGGGLYADGPTTAYGNLVGQNASSNGNTGGGGGIYASGLSDARGNVIVENVARQGGGIYLASSDQIQRVFDNLIARNSASGAGPIAEGGGGLLSESEGAEILYNDIVSNTAAFFGGGMLLTTGNGYLVQRNVVETNSAPYGGGIFALDSTGSVQANWILANSAQTRGGGLYLYANGVPLVDANYILSNTVTGGDAGGICVRNNGAPITLTNQIIAHNWAANGGDGVHVSFSHDVRFLNNTLVDNGEPGLGEGLAASTDTTITLVNNLMVGHGVAISTVAASGVDLDYNGYRDNVVETVGVSWGPNHVDEDPEFVNRAAGNYHLGLTSPMVNAGDAAIDVTRDFERDPRPSAGGMDIGADEVSLRLYIPLTLAKGP
jgi:hypothetical protein